MKIRTHRLLAILFLIAGVTINAQSEAEKTLLKTASKQFESLEFLEALPAYSQLVSIAPDNKDYNFKYGTCLLSSDEDVDKAIKHLKYACSGSGSEDKRAYYYLGKAYHLNYQFAAALRSYKEFKEKVDSKTSNSFRELDRLIVMAENGKELMSDIKDIKVLDKTESTASDFFRNYDMDEIGGSIIKVPEELLSATDKKKGHSPIMYFPEGGGEIIFSSYGNGSHLDLYSVQRLNSGGFTGPVKLPGVVNSPYDEDYPFLHADGRTLYFSSKGHNSMGGYDVFKSKRDLSTGVFESPVNLDFAISSPDDDIFYIVDKDKRIANFASDRNSAAGRLHVYKVAVSNATLEMAIVQGSLVNETGGSAVAQIKVLDANTDEEIGTYRTDDKGEYLIDLPGPGKYKFFIEAEESEVLHTGLVDVPSFGTIKAFKQEMVLTNVAAQEKLIIKNHFDESVDGDVMELALEIIKRKAQLDVNYDGELAVEVEEENVQTAFSSKDVLRKSGFGDSQSMDEVLKSASDQVTMLENKIAEEGVERDKAYTRSLELTERSERQMREATELFNKVQSETDQDAKEELMIQTSVKRAEAEQSESLAAVALLLTKEIDEIVKDNSEQLLALSERNRILEEALTNQDQEKAIVQLEAIKEENDRGLLQVDALDATTKRSLEANREAQKAINDLEQIREARGRALASIKTKDNQLAITTKAKDKEVLEAELRSLNSEVLDLDKQLARSSARLYDQQLEADNSHDAVILLEQIRLGEIQELASLEAKSIPQNGLSESDRRLEVVRTSGEKIELSEEELGRIMTARPELIASLNNEQRVLLAEYNRAVPESLASIDTEKQNEVEEISESTQNTTVETALSTPNATEEVLASPEINDSRLNEAAVETEPATSSESIDTDVDDYSGLSLDDLLNELQADYEGARNDIESSDMDEVHKSLANIDLNRAAVQRLDQRISEEKAKSDFGGNDLMQSNVKAMEMLVNELEAEMLIIAATTETPLQSGDYDFEVSTLNSSQNIPKDISDLAEQSATSDKVEAHARTMAAIDKDASLSEVLKSTSKIKSRVSHIESLQDVLIPSDVSAAERYMRQEAIKGIIQVENAELVTDINAWQEATGTQLTPSEIVLATHDGGYIAKRTLLENTSDEVGIALLNESTASKVKARSEEGVASGVDVLSPSDLNLVETIVEADIEPVLPVHATKTGALEPLTKEKSWTTDVFSDRTGQQKAMAMRSELNKLISTSGSPSQILDKQIEIASAFEHTANEEILWKEEVLKMSSRQNGTPILVTNVLIDAYSLSSRADGLRRAANDAESKEQKAEMLNTAVLLELASLDRMEKAIKLDKHIAKGREISTFSYQEAIVINTGLLMDQSASMLSIEEPLANTEANGPSEIEPESPTEELGESQTVEEEKVPTEEFGNENTVEVNPNVNEEVAQRVTEESVVEEPVTSPVMVVQSAVETSVSEGSETKGSSEFSIADEPGASRVPVIDNVEDLANIESIDADEAIRRYPRISSELTASEILPILSFEDELTLMTETESESQSDVASTSQEPKEMLKKQGLSIEKHQRYRSGLLSTVEVYENERKSRVVRMAEVIDIMNSDGESAELIDERNRLTAEVQIIDSYTSQAKKNLEEADLRIADLEANRDDLLSTIEASEEIIEVPAVQIPADVTEASPEPIEPFVEVVEELTPAITEVVEEVTPAITEEVEEATPTIAVEEVIPVAASPEYDYSSFVMPAVLDRDLFKVSDNDPSRSRSIPIDMGMPSGTVYQVQVGAFRNPIPNEHFSEFDPIMGTKLPNGITRYKVGLFQTESSAIKARDQIRGMGYRDAFVVKYTDGNRDGIIDTQAIASTASIRSNSSSNTQQGETETVRPTAQANPTDSEMSPVRTTQADDPEYYDKVVDAAPATQVEKIKGLFYTVQVGVYSKPVTSSAVFHVSPLNSELTRTGKIKYTSGIFDDINVADQWKMKVRAKGVSDAFVTAYYNGDRVTLEKAALLIAAQGQQILVNIDDLNSLDAGRQGQAIWEMVSTSELFSEEVANQVQFKIRMGPYFKRIPDKDVKIILDFEDNVVYGQTDDGAIIYTTKGKMTYNEAQEWRGKFLKLGITDANIIALMDGEEIPVKQALDFLLK